MKNRPSFILVTSMFLSLMACNKQEKTSTIATNANPNASNIVILDKPAAQLSDAFKAYWYAGEAEISSYKLEQARYGELRDGHAVLIYVTEDFHAEKQVKADRQNPDNIPVLKLNATKNFNTGVYPYSIMQSTFYPVSNNKHAIKVSSSIQEWCGHVYSQLNNKKQFEVMSHSYFESEADQDFTLDKAILENELWTQLRIDPQGLPTGDLEIIPSLEFIRLKHIPLKAYKATVTNAPGRYTINYPELDRNLTINYAESFPYTIQGWEEQFQSGYGPNAKSLTTRATLQTTIQSPYWSKNGNADESLRKTLQLD